MRIQGKFDEAIEALSKATEIDPGKSNLENNLGVALMQSGKSDASEKRLLTAIELDPFDPNPHNNLGVVLQKQGRLEEAMIQFEIAVRLRPDFFDALANYSDLIKARPELLSASLGRMSQFLASIKTKDPQNTLVEPP